MPAGGMCSLSGDKEVKLLCNDGCMSYSRITCPNISSVFFCSFLHGVLDVFSSLRFIVINY